MLNLQAPFYCSHVGLYKCKKASNYLLLCGRVCEKYYELQVMSSKLGFIFFVLSVLVAPHKAEIDVTQNAKNNNNNNNYTCLKRHISNSSSRADDRGPGKKLNNINIANSKQKGLGLGLELSSISVSLLCRFCLMPRAPVFVCLYKVLPLYDSGRRTFSGSE